MRYVKYLHTSQLYLFTTQQGESTDDGNPGGQVHNWAL